MRPLRLGRPDVLPMSFKNTAASATGWLHLTCLAASLLAA
jgi:hypothetical protein